MSGSATSLAAFQVSTDGRFWVSPEEQIGDNGAASPRLSSMSPFIVVYWLDAVPPNELPGFSREKKYSK